MMESIPPCPARLPCNVSFLLPQGMFILLVSIQIRPCLLTFLAIQIDARRIVGENAFRSGDGVDAVVRPRVGYIMLQRERQSVRRFNQQPRLR
jgi:hypothetical protein